MFHSARPRIVTAAYRAGLVSASFVSLDFSHFQENRKKSSRGT
jgi:hypothetical protein